MEYIAAMDYEVDHVVPAQTPQILSIFTDEEDNLSEKDCNSFMGDDNRDTMDASMLTELGTFPLLIRRNSSKGNLSALSADKENSLSRHSSLSKSFSISRGNSVTKKIENIICCSRPVCEPLTAVELPRSCSLQNSLLLIRSVDEDKSSKDSSIFKNTITEDNKITEQVEEEGSDGQNTSDVIERNYNIPVDQPSQPEKAAQLEAAATSYEYLSETQKNEQVKGDSYKNDTVVSKEILSSCRVHEASSPLQNNSVIDEPYDLSIVRHNEQIGTSNSFPTRQETDENSKILSNLQSEQDNLRSKSSQMNEDYTNNHQSGGEVELAPMDLGEPDSDSLSEVNMESETPISVRGSSSVKNGDQLQVSTTSDKTNNKRSRSPSPDPKANQTKQCEATCKKNTGTDDMEDVHTLFMKRNYVRIVLNMIRRANNSSESEESQNPLKDDAISSKPETIETETKTTEYRKYKTAKRRSRNPSADVSVLKKSRREYQTPKKISMITRESVAKFIRQSPNHSAFYVLQKKAQIFKAAENGDLELVRELLHHTGPTVRNGKKLCTLLHTAAANGQRDVVLHMLSLINPNIVNKDGQTPAHLAAKGGHTHILRMFLVDREFHPNKVDSMKKTFRDLLVAPLFEAVLVGDWKRIESLLQLGADPDSHAGKLVDGVLAKELRVTTARQLAGALHGERFLYHFTKVETPSKTIVMNSTHSGTLQNYTKKQKHNGYIYILNFKYFERSQLYRGNSDANVDQLMKVFEQRGYRGNIHSSMTANDTQQTLINIRDSKELESARCATFVISSHGVNRESFLTTDMKILTIEWVMNFFKDSECPQLKNKPKFFIFDFDSGHHLKGLTCNQEENPVRVNEPYNDMICLYSETNKETSEDSHAHSFLSLLGQTLRLPSSNKDIFDVHRELLKECMKWNSGSLPELRSFGFTRKFYLGQ